MISPAVDELAALTSTKKACEVLGRPRASHYRAKQPPVYGPAPKRPSPPNALTGAEQTQVLEALTSERFCDKSVAQTWATLLDEGTYLCSMSTMHRLLRKHGAAGERRRQATHPARKKPELLAVGPGQIWSWDLKCRRRHLRSYADLWTMPTRVQERRSQGVVKFRRSA